MWQRDTGQKSSAPRRKQATQAPLSRGVAAGYAPRQRPRIGQGKRHSVSAKEVIAQVRGSTGFSCRKFTLNPGISATFPRLSKEAATWQHYRFTKLKFKFQTRKTTGDAGGGSVIISPSYNPNEPAPEDETQATNTQDAVEHVTWSPEILCTLKPSSMFPLGNRKQVRYFNLPGDYNVYDAGNLYFCTVGQLDDSIIGNLWVEYTVEFYVPQSTPINPEFRALTTLTTGNANIETAVTEPLPLSTIQDAYNPLDLTIDAKESSFSLPLGCYEIFLEYRYTNFASATGTGQTELILQRTTGGTATSISASYGWTESPGGSHVLYDMVSIIVGNADDSFRVYVRTTLPGTGPVQTGSATVRVLNV